jgi:acyl-CoA synthetase (NDP forming)
VDSNPLFRRDVKNMVSPEALSRMLNPRSIALIGATDELLKAGAMMSANFIACGFEGKVYPVHPKKTEVFNLKAHCSVKDIPDEVDLAYIMVRASLVPQILDECGEKGVKGAIIATSGFKEVGEESLNLEIQRVAAKWGIRFLGPNCLGFYNSSNKLNTTSIPIYPPKGPLGIISQPGSAVFHNFVTAKRRGIGLSKAIHTGNEANIDCVDCLEYLGRDPETKIIGMCLEGVRRGKEFLEVARGISKEKPIIVLKGGRTEIGARAALSHTGALAGSYEVYKAVFKQAGIILAKDIEELFDLAIAFIHQPLPRGRRIGILSHSGGPGVFMSDACIELGLEVPILKDETRRRLGKILPPVGSSRNPVDLDFAPNLMGIIAPCLQILMEDPEIDGVLLYTLMGPSTVDGYRRMGEAIFEQVAKGLVESAREFSQLAKKLINKYHKPVLSSGWLVDPTDPTVTVLMEIAGIPVYFSPEKASRAMASLVQYSAFKNRKEF